MSNAVIERAKAHFSKILEEQLARVERLKQPQEWVNYSALPEILIGVIGGDGIGPYIAAEAQRVLEFMLKQELLYLSPV